MGRLLRQAQAHDWPHCRCGHAVERHTERGQPTIFPCRDCLCADYTKPHLGANRH